MPNYDPPLEHYNYDDIYETCECFLCTRQRATADIFMEVMQKTKGHIMISCHCDSCKAARKANNENLVADQQRNLYSELSFLTHKHPFGRRFLTWILQVIKDKNFKSDAWWARYSEHIPLSTWMHTWQNANISPELIAVSGFF